MMRHRRKLLFLITLIAYICVTTSNAAAAVFTNNRIIDDIIFDNSSSMTASQIDTFLNTFPNSCISPNSGFKAIKPSGYSPSSGYQYSGYVTAGTVIATAAQAYGINPQVLIVTLQKEQSLVAGATNYCNNGDQHKYAAAVGYGCPDGGTTYNYSGLDLYQRNGTTVSSVGPTCVNTAAKAGFSQQIIRAAWLLKFGEQRSEGNNSWAIIDGAWNNSDDPQSCYSGPMTEGTFSRCPSGSSAYFDGYTTIDSTAVHMDTGATAALYWYTPHFHGNQSFFDLFNSWFGATTTNGFIWQPVSQNQYTDSTKSTPLDPNNLFSGQRYYLTVQVKNIGTQTWRRGNVNLGCTQPRDRLSGFRDPTWPAANRAATLQEAVVAPGQTGTFEFWVTAPGPGVYKEYFNLVSEGVAWMNDMGLYFGLTVKQSTYNWQPVSQSQYTDETKTTPIDLNKLAPGISSYHTVTMRNTGNVPWFRGEFNLATSQSRDRTSIFTRAWPKYNRAAFLNEAVVQPGQTGTFEFWMLAPAQTGTFKEYFTPVDEGKTWLTDYGLYFQLTVNKPVFRWDPVSQNAFTDSSKATSVDLANITAGSRYYMTITVKNVGNVNWQRGILNVGTSQPRDRTSPFRDNSWPGPNRPATMDQIWVAPGANATFGFWVTAPSQPGTYKEYYNLVADGITWMNDMGLYFQHTVQ